MTTRAPIVLVDQDGVLANFVTGFWGAFETAHATGPRRTDVVEDTFLIEDQIGDLWREHARAIAAQPQFFRDLEPVTGAADALNAMLAVGWDVYICTTPLRANSTCASDKIAWLEEHIGSGWGKRAIITHDKGLVRGDVLIDDKPTISSVMTPVWQHVVFDAPYNATSSAPHRLTGWDSWHETLAPIVSAVAIGTGR